MISEGSTMNGDDMNTTRQASGPGPMPFKELVDRIGYSGCIGCGVQIATRLVRELRRGVLLYRCDECGKRQLIWLYDNGEPMFDETTGAPGEPASASEADARLADGLPPGPPHEDDEPAPNSPVDIGGPESGWSAAEEAKAEYQARKAESARANLRLLDTAPDETPRQRLKLPPPPDKIAEAKKAKAAAATKRERDAADRKLRKAKREEHAKKQVGFAGLWGKDDKR
jgi:hypothetical protein